MIHEPSVATSATRSTAPPPIGLLTNTNTSATTAAGTSALRNRRWLRVVSAIHVSSVARSMQKCDAAGLARRDVELLGRPAAANAREHERALIDGDPRIFVVGAVARRERRHRV